MAEPIVDRQQGVDPVLTGFVLGTPRPMTMPSQKIARKITTPNVSFQWRLYGKDSLKIKDGVKRAASASIRSSKYTTNQDEDKQERYTYAYEADKDEMSNAIGLDVAGDCANFARSVVENTIELEFATLVTTAANYDVSHVVTIAGGNEWDAAGGDSKVDITGLLQQLSADTRIPMSSFTVFLPLESFNAATQDPVLLAALQISDISAVTEEILAKYWGVKRVWTASAAYVDESDSFVGFYGDSALIYFDESDYGAVDLDDSYGAYTFVCEFSWNEGNALTPYYKSENTTWYFPWERYVKFNMTSPLVGALILNTAA